MIRTILLLGGLPLLATTIGVVFGFMTDRPEDGDHTLAPWLGLACGVIGFVVGVLINASGALAHEGDTQMDAWYRSLTTPAGYSCCNMRDCSPIEARLRDGHWEVVDSSRLLTSYPPQKAWMAVPDEAILKRENADGRPVACIRDGQVVCFVPPAGS